MKFFGKFFKLTLLTLLIVEFLSYVGSLISAVNTAFFFVIVLVALVLSLKKLEYGIYIVLAELFVGSKGYLFYFEYEGFSISVRIALFLIIMSVWLAHLIRKREIEFFKYKISRWYLILFVFIAWGMAWGVFKGNAFQNVFFDANAWFFFGYIFPMFATIKTGEQRNNILQILMAVLLVLALKTLMIAFVFSHNMWTGLVTLYPWVRDTGVGEITQMPYNFARVFFQSQIYSLMGFFILLSVWIYQYLHEKKEYWRLKNKEALGLTAILILNLTAVFISFSRSFWLGAFCAGLMLYIFLLFILKVKFKKILKITGLLISLIVVSLGLIYITINFPYPPKGALFSLSSLGDRATMLSGETAASSRWNLLPVLLEKIPGNPVIGSGFGTTVTFYSEDPRVLAQNIEGMYTTYAFEWGFLDIMIKIGLAGLVVYLIILYKIWQGGYKLVKQNNYLALGLLLGLVALFATHSFSPYLNHPLGIGYVMLLTLFFSNRS